MKRLFGAACLSMISTSGVACTPPPLDFIQREASSIVLGSGSFARQTAGGTIHVRRVVKGPNIDKARLDIKYERRPRNMPGLGCPSLELEGKRTGVFYLFKLKSGHFHLLRFEASR